MQIFFSEEGIGEEGRGRAPGWIHGRLSREMSFLRQDLKISLKIVLPRSFTDT
jgi:hypothetical protein